MSLNYGYRSKHTGSGSGTVGPTGPSGPAGPVGLAGSDGSDGSDGVDGSQGPIGHTGSDGSDGSIGPTGPAGAKGAKGAKGVKGDDGSIGLSSITSDLNMNTNRIIKMAAPTDDTDSTTKEYVDYQCQARLSIDGTVAMSGDLNMGDNRIFNLAAPTSDKDACNRKYVVDGDNQTLASSDGYTNKEVLKLLDLGGARAMTGTLNIGGNKIINLGDPTLDSDSANKKYVDNNSSSILESDGSLNMKTKKITNLGAPTSAGDAVTKTYVDSSGFLKSDGSIAMTGYLKMNQNYLSNVKSPLSDSDGATKKYIDDLILRQVDLTGSRAMTGALNSGGFKILSLGTPTLDTDASTKKYVDDNVGSATIDLSKGLDMKSGKITNMGVPSSTDDAVTYGYALALTNGKLNLSGSSPMTGNLNMGSNRVTNLGAPTADTDSSTKKYVDDRTPLTVMADGTLNMQNQRIMNLGMPSGATRDATPKEYVDAADSKKLSIDGSIAMTGGLDMGRNKITGVSDPSADGDVVNKKYADSKSSVTPADLNKFVSVDKSSYKISYDGGTHEPFTFITSGYNKPYNSGYGTNLTITQGAEATVPVVGRMTSVHIEQDFVQNLGYTEIQFSVTMPNKYWTAGKDFGLVFAAKYLKTPRYPSYCRLDMGNSEQNEDIRKLGTIRGFDVYLCRITYDSSLTPITVLTRFTFLGPERMVVDLYAGSIFDGMTKSRFDSASLDTNLYFPTHPLYDHHKFIDSTVGDVLVAGASDANGILTVDKLLITEKNVDMSPSGWFQKETGRVFVTDLPFGEAVRNVNTFTYHRMVLPPAKRVTLMVMSVDGNTVLGDLMVFELSAKFYVGGGASSIAKLTDIRKSDASARCEGVTLLNKDIAVSLPASCIGFEMFIRQTDTVGPELKKKITILVRVYSD